MKGNLIRSCLFSFALFFSLPLQAKQETFKLDPKHSYVEYHIDHFGFSHPSGKWMVEGTLLLDEKNPEKSKVIANIQVNTVLTGVAELDEHLNKESFFDTQKYPRATFVSKRIKRTGKNSAIIIGTLNLHGVKKQITLQTKLNKKDINPINNTLTAGFSATTTLKRSDFGINTLLPGLGDTVKLRIEVEAKKVSPKTEDEE